MEDFKLVPKPNAKCIVCRGLGKHHPPHVTPRVIGGCPGCFEDRDLVRLPYQAGSAGDRPTR